MAASYNILVSLWFPSPFCRVCLQSKSTLHLICDHFSDGEGGGGCWRGSVPHMEHPTAHIPDPAVKYKVIYKVSVSVESLGSNSRRTPGDEQ